METMKAILERRSIRRYTDKEISKESMEQILKAAMYAPSGGNQQPWEFILIRNKETMAKIQEFHAYSKMLGEANVAVVVCGNKEKLRFPALWEQDCSAATQNILLAAKDLGIGSCWLGVYPEQPRTDQLAELLGCPSHVVPFGIVSLGYPAVEKEVPQDRFNKEAIHEEKWSQ